MLRIWEQWRGTVLLALVQVNIRPSDALALVEQEDEWLQQAFADGEYADCIALDLVSLFTG